MTQTMRDRPASDRAAQMIIAATTDTVPPAADTVRMPLAWHIQTEHEIEMAYAQGWRDGVEHARRAMDAGIREAIGCAPGSAKAVVERLVRTWDQAARRDAVPDRPDYLGGSVNYETGVPVGLPERRAA